MEAEHVDVPHQPAQAAVRDVGGADALHHQPEVVAQLLRVGVAGLARQRVEHVREPVGDESELGPQRLVVAVRAPQHERGRQLGGVALDRRLERGGDRRAPARVRELLRQPVDLLAQEPDGGLAVQGQRPRERLRPDLGMAIHVGAGPRAERQLAPAHGRLEAALELLEDLRHRLVQRRLEEEQVAPDLVLHHRAGAAHLVGLPPDRDRLPQLGLERAPARAADPRVVELVEQAREVELVVEHGAARRLGRVCGEDELDVQRAQRGGEVEPLLAQQLGGLHQRLALARAGRVVVAPAAHALALLGDVRELELERTGADAGLDVLGGQALDQPGEHRVGARLAVAQRCGGLVHPPHRVGEAHAALLDEHVVEHGGEQVGVARERVCRHRLDRVGGDRHRPPSVSEACVAQRRGQPRDRRLDPGGRDPAVAEHEPRRPRRVRPRAAATILDVVGDDAARAARAAQ